MAAGIKTQEIIDRVRVRIAETTVGMITDAEMADFITDAQRDLAWRLVGPAPAALWSLITEEETTVGDGTMEYLFEGVAGSAPGFMKEIYVEYKGVIARRWEPEHIERVRGIKERTPSETAPFYIMWTSGIKFLFTTTQSNGDVFNIVYIAMPADISIGDTGVEPKFTQIFFPAIEDFVVQRCWEQRRNGEAATLAFQQYLEKIGIIIQSYVPGQDVERYQSPRQRA